VTSTLQARQYALVGEDLVDALPPFDWGALELPRGSRLSVLRTRPRQIIRGLFLVGPCVYAITRATPGAESDPAVLAFLWAESEHVARCVYDVGRSTGDATSDECERPPRHVLGFDSFTQGGAFAFERERSAGIGPQLSTSVRYPDGQFLTCEIRVEGREYFFLVPDPGDEEPIAAIEFILRQADRT